MDIYLSFIADIAPWLVLLYALHQLRQPLAAMLGRVAQISIGEHQVILDNEVRELPAQNDNELSAHMSQLIAISPRAAVIESWIALEAAASKRLRTICPNVSSHELRQPLHLVAQLIDRGLLNSHQAMIFHQLRHIRNAAAHAGDPGLNNAAAATYCQHAEQLLGVLEQQAEEAEA